MDGRDNDPTQFWRYVLAALEAAGVDVGTDCLSFLRPPRPAPIEVVLTSMLNAPNTVTDDLVLVLDDYHLIDNDTIHRGVAFFLAHLPARLHLVLSTRTDPPCPSLVCVPAAESARCVSTTCALAARRQPRS
jgi:LuxR family maltose regulon positive regulatory protein